MKQLQWTFPVNPLTADFDVATEAFRTFSKGVCGLHPDADLAGEIRHLDADWSQLLAFLASMYRLQSRSSQRRAIAQCIHNIWKRDPEFRDLLESLTRHSVEEGNEFQFMLPWLTDDWRIVYEVDAAANAFEVSQTEAASAALVQEFAPSLSGHLKFFGRAEKCFRCGELQGYIFNRQGFGWRQRTHDLRCAHRMLDRS